jgi:hypothetical protein
MMHILKLHNRHTHLYTICKMPNHLFQMSMYKFEDVAVSSLCQRIHMPKCGRYPNRMAG